MAGARLSCEAPAAVQDCALTPGPSHSLPASQRAGVQGRCVPPRAHRSPRGKTWPLLTLGPATPAPLRPAGLDAGAAMGPGLRAVPRASDGSGTGVDLWPQPQAGSSPGERTSPPPPDHQGHITWVPRGSTWAWGSQGPPTAPAGRQGTGGATPLQEARGWRPLTYPPAPPPTPPPVLSTEALPECLSGRALSLPPTPSCHDLFAPQCPQVSSGVKPQRQLIQKVPDPVNPNRSWFGHPHGFPRGSEQGPADPSPPLPRTPGTPTLELGPERAEPTHLPTALPALSPLTMLSVRALVWLNTARHWALGTEVTSSERPPLSLQPGAGHLPLLPTGLVSSLPGTRHPLKQPCLLFACSLSTPRSRR